MRKILFLISEDWNVVSHFLPLIRGAVTAGFEVLVATRVQNHRSVIEAEGARVIPLATTPRTLGMAHNLKFISELCTIVAREKPTLVHCVTLRMCFIGGIAARLAGCTKLVLAPTGLGHLWLHNAPVHRAVRAVVRTVMAGVLPMAARVTYIFENSEDPKVLGLKPGRHDVVVVGGAGVDPYEYPFRQARRSAPVRAAFVGRLTREKGLSEAVEAVLEARRRGAAIELHIFGDPDPFNPSSYNQEELHRLIAGRDGIVMHGRVDHAAAVWKDHDIAILLSHREGLPRSLVEAAASGRPIIATDVVGCRSVVRHGIDGLLVPLGDNEAAASALVALTQDFELRRRMGAQARANFETTFTENSVRKSVAKVYMGLVGVPCKSRSNTTSLKRPICSVAPD